MQIETTLTANINPGTMRVKIKRANWPSKFKCRLTKFPSQNFFIRLAESIRKYPRESELRFSGQALSDRSSNSEDLRLNE